MINRKLEFVPVEHCNSQSIMFQFLIKEHFNVQPIIHIA